MINKYLNTVCSTKPVDLEKSLQGVFAKNERGYRLRLNHGLAMVFIKFGPWTIKI